MYLDHNAGGRVRAEAASAVSELLREGLANPTSVHAAGRAARARLEAARDEVAALVGARSDEVVFTSGGTEANNLAVLGIADPGVHVVATPIEHASLLRALERAQAAGMSVDFAPVRATGRVSAAAVAGLVGASTRLVSVGWANGEIGTVQPIAEIVAAVRARSLGRRVLCHSDAVQAAGLCAIDIAAVDLDLLSLSAHKLGGLPGVGAIVVRRGTVLAPQLLGGPQERERRAGTENLPGIVAFGVAARLARAEREGFARLAAARREALWRMLAETAQPIVRLSPDDGLPNTLAVSFPGLRGDALVIALDLAGVATSSGSACAAGAAEPSHVVRALATSEEIARGALRLSFGSDLTAEGARSAAAAIAETVRRARAAAPERRPASASGGSRAA